MLGRALVRVWGVKGLFDGLMGLIVASSRPCKGFRVRFQGLAFCLSGFTVRFSEP